MLKRAGAEQIVTYTALDSSASGALNGGPDLRQGALRALGQQEAGRLYAQRRTGASTAVSAASHGYASGSP
ncbi:hypothetical protein ACWCXH_05705 [Kitasatospora sp. NPDC001660]